VLRSVAPRYEHTEQTLAYESAAEAASHLLIAASDEFIDEYRSLLSTGFGPAVSQAGRATLVEEIVAQDPVEDAIWTLQSIGKDAHRHGDVLHLHASAGNPVLAALAAVGAAESAAEVGAWAGHAAGKWALVMWTRPDLFTVESRNGKVLWRHYVLTGLLTPNVLAHARDLEGAQLIPHGPLLNPIREAAELIERLGLHVPAPPANCHEL